MSKAERERERDRDRQRERERERERRWACVRYDMTSFSSLPLFTHNSSLFSFSLILVWRERDRERELQCANVVRQRERVRQSDS
jgi:hypothetical protein